MIQLLAFGMAQQRYALPLAAVERVVRAVEITPLPKAPPMVLGIVNIGGHIVPVFNVRSRFRLPERDMDLRDQLILDLDKFLSSEEEVILDRALAEAQSLG